MLPKHHLGPMQLCEQIDALLSVIVDHISFEMTSPFGLDPSPISHVGYASLLPRTSIQQALRLRPRVVYHTVHRRF